MWQWKTKTTNIKNDKINGRRELARETAWMREKIGDMKVE